MVNYLKIMLSRSGNSHLIFLWIFPLSTLGINLQTKFLSYSRLSLCLYPPRIPLNKKDFESSGSIPYSPFLGG